MIGQSGILQYGFLQYFYFGDTKTYETILCECLNMSTRMKEIGGSDFSLVENQSHKEDDVVALYYSLDFKLMISPSLAEFQSLTTRKAHEVAPGVHMFSEGKATKQDAVLLLNMCRNITKEKLKVFRRTDDQASKDVLRFFEKSLNKPKHILIFLPAYIQTIEQTLSEDEKYETVHNELSNTLRYIYDFRKENQPGFDTYFVYILNISVNHRFLMVINRFCETGLEMIDRIDYFSLPTVQKQASIYIS